MFLSCPTPLQSTPKRKLKMDHSKIVGGSTAKRVMNCPGSVALVQKMPPQPSNKYADEGTLLHNVIAEIVMTDKHPEEFLHTKYNDQILTLELIDNKLVPALAALDVIDPNKEMEIEAETRVGFGDLLPDVFGSTDLIGRIGKRAVVLDWKFGDGVAVDAEENPQLMFYAAAAMRTEETKWAFVDVEEIEMVIVQPPAVKRWVTTPARIAQFEKDLVKAVKLAQQPNAELKIGDHCRWCAAKPICPQMTGAVDRALKTQVEAIDAPMLGAYLANADMLEQWITDLRALALQILDSGAPVPGYKLVAKRGTRQWVDEAKASKFMEDNGVIVHELKIKSPAVVEKELKKSKVTLPDDIVVSVSSGTTLAAESDPRPAVLQIGKQLTAALSKLQ
jgi:hypothetical protein